VLLAAILRREDEAAAGRAGPSGSPLTARRAAASKYRSGEGTAGVSPLIFDLWSHFYDAPWLQRLTYRPVHDAILRALRESPEQRTLDIGCGTGLLAVRLRHELPEAFVVGCDFSHGMLRRARGRSRDVAWIRGNAMRLPFGDHSFDVVVSTESFHWIPDQEVALAEFFRVLAPGGRLLVALLTPPLELLSQAARVGSRLLGKPVTWPTRRRMRDQVRAAGFRVTSQTRIHRIPAGLMLPPVLTVATRPE
jgi:ubiquinone/menaquinone biosynthesis C-methylase UbiE